MHRLNRDAVTVPDCLLELPEGSRYSDLHGHEREQIRARLLELQRHRCAYCERRTGDERDDGHIEHFRKQADRRDLEVSWNNMFWSCNDEKTCGKHKDKCDRLSGNLARFNPDDIVDPSIEDPDHYFLFVVDGTVRPIEGLDANRQRRCSETLRVFQLATSAFLRRSRQDAVQPYVSAIASLLSAEQDLVVKYVQSELERLDSTPFATTIRQYLEGFLV